MVAVAFTYGVYLHDAVDLEDFIVGDRYAPSFSQQPQGRVQITGAGRRRWSGRRGIDHTLSFLMRVRGPAAYKPLTIPWTDEEAWLADREGRTVLYRDERGRRAFAVITDFQLDDVQPPDVKDIQLSLSVVDQQIPVLDGSDL